MALTDEC